VTSTALPQAPQYDDAVDLDRYPINDPASRAYRALVQTCREQLRSDGVAQLTGFLTPAAVGQMLTVASQLAGQTWASDQTHTVYFEPVDDSAGPDHPRALLQHSAKKAIAYDQIPASAPIRRLYESDDLTGFIAAVLDKPVLYRSADPLDALEIAIFDDGDELGWHFDNSEFSVTVMYQQSHAGGHFDYYPRLRDEHDENYPGVQQILRGASDGVLQLPTSPGTLAVFRGQHAMHRVTPVGGPRPRINSVLTYGEHPGMKLSELTQRLFYGRAA
jgi:alkylated DNA repair dioxygenase AlkB